MHMESTATNGTGKANGFTKINRQTRVRVTPDAAATMLEANTRNRPLRESSVKEWARRMKAGSWQYNPADPIVFTASGWVANGQHRLHAAVRSGCTIEVDVVRGADDEIFRVLDCGARRSAGDTLTTGGLVSPQKAQRTAAVVVEFAKYVRGDILGGKRSRLSNDEVAMVFAANPWIGEFMETTTDLRHHPAFAKTSGGMLIRALTLYAEGASDGRYSAFWEPVMEGTNLEAGDVRLALRNYWCEGGAAQRNHRILSQGMGIKAWNAWTTNRKIVMLRHRIKDEFPLVIGAEPERFSLGL